MCSDAELEELIKAFLSLDEFVILVIRECVDPESCSDFAFF